MFGLRRGFRVLEWRVIFYFSFLCLILGRGMRDRRGYLIVILDLSFYFEVEYEDLRYKT